MLAWVTKINTVKIRLVYVLGLVVAMVAGGATTAAVLAAIPDSGGVIHGCYKNTGVLSVIDSATQSCPGNTTALNWNQAGPAGTGSPVAFAHFEMVFNSGNGWSFAGVDPNFPSSNVTVLSQVDHSDTNHMFYDCITVGGSPKGVMVSPQVYGGFPIGVDYGFSGDSEFSSLNSDANCPAGTNFILAEVAGNNPTPVFLYAY